MVKSQLSTVCVSLKLNVNLYRTVAKQGIGLVYVMDDSIWIGLVGARYY